MKVGAVVTLFAELTCPPWLKPLELGAEMAGLKSRPFKGGERHG